MAAIVQDLFLDPQDRLTEQERALMGAMLHGLVERVAVELRARLSPEQADVCDAVPDELITDLTRAGLLQDEALVRLLLRRADAQRIATAGRSGRSTLQRWTSSKEPALAAAAMALLAARGRGRDRFGRIALDLNELPAPLAQGLVFAIAAALALRCGEKINSDMAAAASALLASRAERAPLEELEAALMQELGSERRREPALLVALAEEGDASTLSALLAAEASIPAEEAWSALLGGAERAALLFRLAGLQRGAAAALLAASGPALGLGDPVRALEAFDSLGEEQMEAIRAELALPAPYRRARKLIGRHG